jgi:hypothetical protein
MCNRTGTSPRAAAGALSRHLDAREGVIRGQTVVARDPLRVAELRIAAAGLNRLILAQTEPEPSRHDLETLPPLLPFLSNPELFTRHAGIVARAARVRQANNYA